MMDNILIVFYIALGTLGFGLLFNIRGIKLICGTLLGAVVQIVFMVVSHFIASSFLVYLLAALTGAVISEVLAVALKCPATVFRILSILPLVPGGGLYKTMSYALSKNYDMFSSEGLNTLKISFALAFGILIVTVIVKAYRHVKADILKRRKLKKVKV